MDSDGQVRTAGNKGFAKAGSDEQFDSSVFQITFVAGDKDGVLKCPPSQPPVSFYELTSSILYQMHKKKLQPFTDKVKSAIRQIDSSAKVILYGSRARGDARSESDWDILILLNHSPDINEQDLIRRHLFKIELETGQAISTIIRNVSDWEAPRNQYSPFYKNIISEGINL